MPRSFKATVQDAQRRRALADHSRAGRFARGLAWERQWNYVGRAWRYLVFGSLGVPASFLPLALLASGGLRWAIVGASVATGLWVTIPSVLLYSGAAGALMSVSTEALTADRLRRLRRRGWRLVNGFRLRPLADIDHVAVGPPGVFVLETKWSEDPWPIGVEGDTFMRNRLASAVVQVRRNAHDFAKHFNRDVNDIPVFAALVLWSGSPWTHEREWVDREGVTIVRGSALEKWLGTHTTPGIDSCGINRLWDAIEKHTAIRDVWDEKSNGTPRPTLEQIFSRHLPLFFLGLAAGTYTWVAIASLLESSWAVLVVSLAALILGWRCRLVASCRWAAFGWIGAFGATLIAISALELIRWVR